MASLTYRELGAAIATMTEEQLNMDVTISTETEGEDGEYYKAELMVTVEPDVLDAHHPYLKIV